MMRPPHTGSRLARAPRALLVLGIALSLVTGWCAAALHHHDDCAPASSRDACTVCAVAKVVAAPPPAPVAPAVTGRPEALAASAPEAAPVVRRLSPHLQRGPPRG